MTDLITTKQTMSSREIAQLTGKSHSHVLRDCDNLNANYLKMNMNQIWLVEYNHPIIDNRRDRVFNLTKMQTFDLMTGYNTELRIKVNRRWAELEAEKNKQHNIPKTYSQALMLAARQAEKLELQAKQIQELEPKGKFYDVVTDSKTAIDIGNAAKVLDVGIGRNKLFKKLRDLKILQSNNVPYQEFIDRGYFRIIESKYQKSDGSTHISLKTLVYQRGIDFIMRKITTEYGRLD